MVPNLGVDISFVTRGSGVAVRFEPNVGLVTSLIPALCSLGHSRMLKAPLDVTSARWTRLRVGKRLAFYVYEADASHELRVFPFRSFSHHSSVSPDTSDLALRSRRELVLVMLLPLQTNENGP